MANFRQIHVSIWKDEWFLGLEPEKKLLFVYLFSNSETTIAGLYKIAFPVICFETGLAGEFVKAALSEFEEADKIMYGSGVMWIKNMRKFHSSKSPKVLTRIRTDLENIPYCEVKISYLYHIDTGSQEKEKEKENKKETEKVNIGTVYQLYEHEIGVISPMISDDIQAYWNDISENNRELWFKEAIGKSAMANKRSWSYVKAILDSWISAGRMTTWKQKEVDSELEKYR